MGVSADSPATQRKFVEKFALTFPMVPDPDKTVINAYGTREVLGLTAKQSTFLVDPEGVVAAVWPRVNVEGHAEDVVATLRKVADARKAPATS